MQGIKCKEEYSVCDIELKARKAQFKALLFLFQKVYGSLDFAGY